MSKLFDIEHQLVFYGKYHSNKYNVAIHMCFVPIILWCTLIILVAVPPTPSSFPSGTVVLAPYLAFQWSWAVPFAGLYAAYYFALDPVAALLYMPLLSAMLLSAAPIAAAPWGKSMAIWLMTVSWVAQFGGHGFAEKRSPALLDNIVGAFVLAPFFVHLEILFALGYRGQLHRQVMNGVGIEVAKFRKEQGDAQRAKAM